MTLRIGSIDDAEAAFTWFRPLEVAPDGRIFTIHPPENLIRIHSPEGEYLGTLGGIGEGPGEFMNPTALGFLGDSIWVLDRGTYRFSYFTADGTFLRVERIPIDPGFGGPDDPARPSGLLTDGTIWGSRPAWSDLVAAGEIMENAYVRLSPGASVEDTVAPFSLVNTTLALIREGERGATYTRQPYSDTEIVVVSEDRPEVVRVMRPHATSDAISSFRVSKLSLERDTLWSRTYAYEPVRLEASVAEGFGDGLGKGFLDRVVESGFMPRHEAEEKLREALYRPPYYPPVREAIAGRDGSIWLQMGRPESETTPWWILAPDGELLGEVQLPRFLVLAAEQRQVWGLELDELDVSYIVRYAIRP